MARAYAALWCGFLIWGIFPIYFRYFASLRSDEFLFARIILSVLSFILYFTVFRRWQQVRNEILNRYTVKRCLFTALFLATNWFIYIWAVQHGEVLQASFGYYITPIINVAFGLCLFRERLSHLQWSALFCIFAGVVYYSYALGLIPWVSLGIAAAWGLYGGLHKKWHIAPVNGLFLELLILLPVALLGLAMLYINGKGFSYSGKPTLFIALLGSGVITLLPLLLFLYAVRHLPMVTVGIAQYLTPSIQFAIAVWLFHEPFATQQLVTFILIWVGLTLYSIHLFHTEKGK